MSVVAVVNLGLYLESWGSTGVSRRVNRCIRPSRTNLKLTGPML